jgi:hypothetical protein
MDIAPSCQKIFPPFHRDGHGLANRAPLHPVRPDKSWRAAAAAQVYLGLSVPKYVNKSRLVIIDKYDKTKPILPVNRDHAGI